MFDIIYTTQFKKDLKLAKKRGKDMRKLKYIIRKVANDERLDSKYKEHKLMGKYKNRWECHIEPD
jgi:mRNA interferase YafQ